MEELSFRELRHTQQKIMDYKNLIADKIGLINDSGKRVLNPRFFLSGEVAAYKFLCYWEKKMEQGEDFIDAKVLGLMEDIKWMLYWADQDFAEEDTLIEYEGCNTSLWIDLLAGKSNEARRKIDRDIVAIAALSEFSKGKEDEETNDFLRLEEEDFDDHISMGYAYGTAHEWLMTLEPEMVERLFTEVLGESELYKLHFHLFQ